MVIFADRGKTEFGEQNNKVLSTKLIQAYPKLLL